MNTTLEIARPDSTQLSAEVNPFLSLVESMQIDSPVMYEAGADELKAIKQKAASLEEQRKKIKAPILEAGRGVDELFREPIEVLSKAEGILKRKLLTYQDEQARKAREERAAREAAAKAERERLEAEAQRLREAAAANAAAAKAAEEAGNKEDAEKARALALEASQRAETKTEIANLVQAAPAVVEAPKVSGIATKTEVDFEVVDILAIAAHVVAHPEDRALITVDSVKLRARVRSQGLDCNVPGVRVFEKKSLSASKRG